MDGLKSHSAADLTSVSQMCFDTQVSSQWQWASHILFLDFLPFFTGVCLLDLDVNLKRGLSRASLSEVLVIQHHTMTFSSLDLVSVHELCDGLNFVWICLNASLQMMWPKNLTDRLRKKHFLGASFKFHFKALRCYRLRRGNTIRPSK